MKKNFCKLIVLFIVFTLFVTNVSALPIEPYSAPSSCPYCGGKTFLFLKNGITDETFTVSSCDGAPGPHLHGYYIYYTIYTCRTCLSEVSVTNRTEPFCRAGNNRSLIAKGICNQY